MRARGLIVGAALLAAGCTVQVIAPPGSTIDPLTGAVTQKPAALTQPVSAPIGFRCLPRGTVQTYSDGNITSWLGYDPSNSDICVGRSKEGRTISTIRGIWNIGSYWPDTIPAMRTALTDLTTKPVGTVATFTATGSTANKDDPRPGTWTHTLRVLNREALTTPAGAFQAYVIEDDYRNTFGTGQWKRLFWVDAATGALLKVQTVAASNGAYPKWETVALRLPPQS